MKKNEEKEIITYSEFLLEVFGSVLCSVTWDTKNEGKII